MPKRPEFQFNVDGTDYTLDDLTYGEQREVRRLVRELSEDPNAEIIPADPMDRAPAMVCVIRRRDNPEYTIEEAQEVKPGDVWREVKAERPTRAAKAAA